MYYFITDETNLTPNKSVTFFLYGGLAFSEDQAEKVHDAIEKIRQQYGLKPEDKLKFDTNSRPKNVSIADYTEAKNAVVTACRDAGATFICYLIHHNIAGARLRAEFALNTVVAAFNTKLLKRANSSGIVFMDRVPDESAGWSMLKDRFQKGLTGVDWKTPIRLENIIMYATTCDGASHLSSAVDIVLGGMRWVVNQKGRPEIGDTQRNIFRNIAAMLLHEIQKDGKRSIYDLGLITRPVYVHSSKYKAEYDDLTKYIDSLLQEVDEN